ncbi:MAG: galactokinase [Clostridia bacterium]|nr:galactokinase [Clostridia bacterium]MBR2289034.1 galactokinase [Clostridia bacterium]
MSVYDEKIAILSTDEVAKQLAYLYGNQKDMVEAQRARYEELIRKHEKYFGTTKPIHLISAPGRMEIGGNHTDHNHGKVLAASASLDTLAAVSVRDDSFVRVRSDGYPLIEVDLRTLTPRQAEQGKTAGLIRGVAERMTQLGYNVGGFEATITSSVVSGSGLSSSAAYEVMTVAILDKLYNKGDMDFKVNAIVSQYAENVHFGKPSGLLDQMASAAGGLVTVDFQNPQPEVRALGFDFASRGYAICVVAPGGSHANLTDHYAAIPVEMKQVAKEFGKDFLREVPESEFRASIGELHKKLSDRAILRAMHFYAENRRVDTQVAALEAGDLNAFFEAIIESGRSSAMYLQNIYAFADKQPLSVALALAEDMLKGKGAWRVHGGGFAGTTLNFVPLDLLGEFRATMERAFGPRSCLVLNIRPVGAYELA